MTIREKIAKRVSQRQLADMKKRQDRAEARRNDNWKDLHPAHPDNI
jgi:hypothetical protein